jgi:hypothetical protein
LKKLIKANDNHSLKIFSQVNLNAISNTQRLTVGQANESKKNSQV